MASGPALDVSYGGLSAVAAALSAAAGNLAAVAAVAPVHTPLAADEVSTSAAARLNEHGAVLASRAGDGASVLAAAARAVVGVSTHLAEIDSTNAAGLATPGAVLGAPAGGPLTQAGIKANMVSADTPIMAMAPRPGELTAGLVHAGHSSLGAAFHTACRGYERAFEAAAVAARSAQRAVATTITGHTGPTLAAALGTFAAWADAMTAHSATVAQSALDHSRRFAQTQQQTPQTQQFTSTRAALSRAQMLMMQTGGLVGGEQVAAYGQRLQQLDARATAAGAAYHLAEVPQAPPPPPPVTDIVTSGGGGTSTPPTDTAATPAAAGDPAAAESAVSDLAAAAAPLSDPLTTAAGAGPLGADPVQQILPMAAAIPSMVAGALGGALGAVTSIPAAVGQQAMSAAQQLIQAATVSTKEPDTALLPDHLDDAAGLSDAGLGGGGLDAGAGGGGADLGGAGGGGVGGMEPAGLDALPPSGGALAAASAPPSTPALPVSSGAVTTTPAAAASAGAGGMGMGMMPPPMMSGMGGGRGVRQPAPPDKSVKIPFGPNDEPVMGQVTRRETVSVNDQPGAAQARPTDPPAPPGRPRRRVVVADTTNEGNSRP